MKTIFLTVRLLVILSITPAFAQQSNILSNVPVPSQLQTISKYVNNTGINATVVQSWTSIIGSSIQNAVNGIIQGANLKPNSNPLNITSGKIQAVSNQGFQIAGDITKVGFDLNSLIFVLFGLSPYEVPFWIILVISAVISVIVLMRFGKIMIEKGAIIIGLILAAILLLTVLAIHSNAGT